MKTLSLMFFLFVLSSIQFPSYSQIKVNPGLPGGLGGELTIGAYVDVYGAWDNDKSPQPRQFSAIAPYRDEFRLNMLMAYIKYDGGRVRGNAVLQFGDVPKLNWPQAPNEYLQYIQEANIGVSPGKNTWIDAGYFLTHIGGEGILPKYNFFTSLSLCTYYEPFYQSGIKVSYTGKKFYGALMVLNGFNVFADNNKNKSFGMQLGYKPNDKLDITYNNIIGNEMPTGVEGRTRIYNNLVVKIYPGKKTDIILCGDFCMQEKSKISDPTASASMFSGYLSVKYRLAKRVSASVRGEMFQDKDAILSALYNELNENISGLKASGFTLGVEYNPTDNSYFRVESRYMITDTNQKIFYDGTKTQNNRVEAILSGGIDF
jgi:hypothetical protein